MSPFSLTILGSSSATPTANRHPSSQLLNFRDKFFLLDCGEGAQLQLRRYKLPFAKIDHIFISHLHGDHCFGLIGLISSFHLLNRSKALNIYAPAGLQELVEHQLKLSNSRLVYEIKWHVLDQDEQLVLNQRYISVKAIKLKHSLSCWGFIFQEKTPYRKIDKSALEKYDIPIHQRHALKQGMDVTDAKGNKIENKLATLDPDPARMYAYLTDTVPLEKHIPHYEGANMIYHEATFLDADKKRAKQTMHSTAKQAAELAAKANVKKLIIGHFSARYKDLRPLHEEAKLYFEETSLALEGTSYDIL